MYTHKWTEQENELLKSLYQRHFTYSAIAKKLNRTHRAIKCKISELALGKEYGYRIGGSPVKELKNTGLNVHESDYFFPIYDKYLKINKHSATVISDCHLPYMDWNMWDKCLKVANKLKIDTLVIAGDLFNQDAFTIFVGDSDKKSWRKEKEVGGVFFKQALDNFKEIYLIAGNHDMRFFRIVMGQIDYPDWLKMVSDNIGKRIVVAGNYRYCDFGLKWHITHPKNYSKISTRVAEQIAVKTQRSIISGHGHHQGIRYDPSAKLLCIDCGSMIDAKKCEYTSMVDTTHPYWNCGFVVLQDEYPTLFSNKLTDWKKF